MATWLRHAVAAGPTWTKELTRACEGQGTAGTAMVTTMCHSGAEETRGEAELHATILWVMANLLGDPVGGDTPAPQLRLACGSLLDRPARAGTSGV